MGSQRAAAPRGLLKAPFEWGATPPLPSALVRAALEDDPAAKAQVLAVNAMTPLERALACFQRSILARDS
jgi:hypothetical protein